MFPGLPESRLAEFSDEEHAFWLREARRARSNWMCDLMHAANAGQMEKKDIKSLTDEMRKWMRYEDRVDEDIPTLTKQDRKAALRRVREMLGGGRKG